MKNGWTGGQYSIVRAILGTYLFVYFLALLPDAHALFHGALSPDASLLLRLFPNILAIAPLATPRVLLAAIASILFAIGLYDRIAAVVILYVLACLANASLLYAGWLLIAHAFVPPAPFGSWSARGRIDPRGNWRMPPGLFAAMWIVVSLGYTFSGWTKLARVLASPLPWPAILPGLLLSLLYAPLALFRRARPWIWTAMLVMHLGLLLLNGFADLSFMMVVLHLFTFDPSWVRARTPEMTDTLLYDGSCGLCHRSVRLILAEDRSGTAFRFAPLPEDKEKTSAIVKTADGRTFTRSDAVIHILHRLGGLWRVIATVSGVVPGVVRNAMYDGVARIRYRIFGRTKDACPLLPPDLRSRFNA